MAIGYVPQEVFFTRGVGVHKERLSSFEMALRQAGIASFNLVTVSSILPAGCKRVSRSAGLKNLTPGEIVYCVMARADVRERGRIAVAGVGGARPRDKNHFGYLSEHHGYGMTAKETGDYVEDLAVEMLCTILDIDYDTSATWDEKREIWKISGDIYESFDIVQTASGKGDRWTTVLTAAVFCG